MFDFHQSNFHVGRRLQESCRKSQCVARDTRADMRSLSPKARCTFLRQCPGGV
ncbi:hypothetical protein [Massilia consociata]|uniref:Uncharacterized protein n=1 Tax=Massilia consociata TaxID=760117 RepID=A0ABV6FHJ5_9BURK